MRTLTTDDVLDRVGDRPLSWNEVTAVGTTPGDAERRSGSAVIAELAG